MAEAEANALQAGTSQDALDQCKSPEFLQACLEIGVKLGKFDQDLLQDITDACDINDLTALELGGGLLTLSEASEKLFLMPNEASGILEICRQSCLKAGIDFGDGAAYDGSLDNLPAKPGWWLQPFCRSISSTSDIPVSPCCAQVGYERIQTSLNSTPCVCLWPCSTCHLSSDIHPISQHRRSQGLRAGAFVSSCLQLGRACRSSTLHRDQLDTGVQLQQPTLGSSVTSKGAIACCSRCHNALGSPGTACARKHQQSRAYRPDNASTSSERQQAACSAQDGHTNGHDASAQRRSEGQRVQRGKERRCKSDSAAHIGAAAHPANPS